MADADWALYKQLRGKPLPETVDALGASYTLKKTLKRDFYAVVGLFERQDEAGDSDAPRQVLLKVYHTDAYGPLPLGWLGRWLCRRETRFYHLLDGLPGVPRFLGAYGESGLLREFVPG